MRPPKCRLCAAEHWGMCPKFKDIREPLLGKTVKPDAPPRTGYTRALPNNPRRSPVERSKARTKARFFPVSEKKQCWDREKYNEYQKLLMRERRAKEKERLKARGIK